MTANSVTNPASGPYTTTLGAAFTVNSVTFTGTLTANTAGTTITAAPSSNNTLTIMAANNAAGANYAAGTGIMVLAGSGPDAISANVVLGASQTWTNNSSSALTVSGVISDGGANYALATAGSGVFALTGVNTFGGGATIGGTSTVQINNAQSLGAVSAAATLAGGTLEATASIASSRAFNINGAGTIQVDPTYTYSISGVVADGSSSGALTKTGAGTLNLGSSSNSYTGGTTISAGTVQLGASTSGSTGPLGAVTNSLAVGASGTLDLNANTLTVGTLTGAGTVGNSATTAGGITVSGTSSFGGTIVDTLGAGSSTTALTVNGAGTNVFTLTGANTYTGGTTITTGTLALASGASLGGTAVSVGASGVLQLVGAASGSSSVTIGSGSAGSVSLSGALSFNDTASSNAIATTLNINSGATNTGLTLNASTLNFNATSPTKLDEIIDQGKLALNGTVTVNLPGATLSSTPGTYPLITYASVSGSGAFQFSDHSSSEIIGTTTYTLVANANGKEEDVVVTQSSASTPVAAYWGGAQGDGIWNTLIGTSTNWLTAATGGTDTQAVPGSVTDVFETANSATSLVQTLGANFTINSLTFTGTGTANAAGVTITGGAYGLTINAAASQIGGAGYSAGTGIVVQTGAGADTINAAITLGGAQSWANNSASLLTIGGTVNTNGNLLTIAGSGSGGATFSNAIGGSGGLTMNASGATLTLTGANTYTGATTVSSGALALSAGGSLAGTAVTVATGATLEINGAATGPSTYAIGSGSAGSVALGGALTFNDQANIATTLNINSGAANTGLTLNASTLNVNTTSVTSIDKIADQGAAVLNGTVSVNLSNAFTLNLGTYPLVTFASETGAGSYQFASTHATTEVVGSMLYTLTTTGTAENIVVTSNASTPASAYWTGLQGSTWNTVTGSAGTNWAAVIAGTPDANAVPGATSNVYFAANNAATANFSNTTLGAAMSINSLTVLGTGPAAGAAVGINGSNALTIEATNANGNTAGTGITVNSGAGAVSIGAPVVLGGSQTWTNNASNQLTVSGGVTGSGFNLTVGGSGATVIDGLATGAGALTVSGGALTLGGVNSYSGATNITAGSLLVGASGSLTGSATIGVSSGASFALASGGSILTSTALTDNGSVTLNSATTIASLNGSTGAATLTLNSSNLTVSNGGSFTGTIADGSGAGSLTVSGGTLALSGANTYSGGTALASGATLDINSATALGTGAFTINGGTIDNTSSGAVSMTANNPLSWLGSFTFTGSNALNFGTGAVTVAGAGVTVTVSHSTLTVGGSISGGPIATAGAGVLALSGANSYTGGTTVGAGSTLELIGSGTLGSGTVALASSSSTLNLFTSSNLTIANLITGAGNLIQNGSGTTSLTAANTYSGSTTVNAGTLLINGAYANSGSTPGTFVVNSGGTLGGAGSIQIVSLQAGSSAINVASGGVFMPGYNPANGAFNSTSNATLSVNVPSSTSVAVDMHAGSSFNVTLNNAMGSTSPLGAYGLPTGTYYPYLSVAQGVVELNNGSFLPGATLNLSVAAGQTLSAGESFVLIDPTSTTGTFTLGQSTVGGFAYTVNYTAGPSGADVVITLVPEPSSLALGLLAGAGALWVIARRRKRIESGSSRLA